MSRCPTCVRPAHKPYRRSRLSCGHVVEGTPPGSTVVEGCVDAFHNDYADDWHQRPVAAGIRSEIASRLSK